MSGIDEDPCDRETAWLTTAGDGLPALATADGPWGLIQAYQTRTPGSRVVGQIYVTCEEIREQRFANQRRMVTYDLVLRIAWPLSSGVGSAEADQRALMAAVRVARTRIGGFRGDKTHGGRFLSVAENPPLVTVRFEDPSVTVPAEGEFRASIRYSADDQDFTG